MMRYWEYGMDYDNFFMFQWPWMLWGLMIPFTILDLVLRGFALWKSAKRDQNIWFIALLIINSVGILPLIYLLLNRDEIKASKKKK